MIYSNINNSELSLTQIQLLKLKIILTNLLNFQMKIAILKE